MTRRFEWSPMGLIWTLYVFATKIHHVVVHEAHLQKSSYRYFTSFSNNAIWKTLYYFWKINEIWQKSTMMDLKIIFYKYISLLQDYEDKLHRLMDSLTCRICMDNQIDVAFLPCAHMVTCHKCASRIDKCPVCRSEFTKAQKLHLPCEFTKQIC